MNYSCDANMVARDVFEPGESVDIILQRPCSQYDNVTKPKHYQLFDGEKEVIDLITDRCDVLYVCNRVEYTHSLAYKYGNAIKYLMRWSTKNGVEDLKKCRQYLDMMIEDLDAR